MDFGIDFTPQYAHCADVPNVLLSESITAVVKNQKGEYIWYKNPHRTSTRLTTDEQKVLLLQLLVSEDLDSS